MLTSSPSPSPTIHANAASSVTSTTTAPFRCAYDSGSYRQRHSLPAFFQQSRSRRASNTPVGKWSSVSAPAGTAAAATASTSTITSITTSTEEAANGDASAVAPRRTLPAGAKRPSPARPAPVTRDTVDAGTQYSPPLAAQQRTEKSTSKAVGLATGGSNDFTLIDLGRTGKRRAGSPSSQKSSSSGGEPRAPALGPQMPEHRAVPEKAPAAVSPMTTQEPAVVTASRSSTPEKTKTTTTTTTTTTTEKPASPARDSADALTLSKRLRTAMPAIRIMAARYEQCDTKHLVRLIADMLMELVRFNDDIPLKDGRLTRFHSRAPPGISIHDYLQRLATHATLSPPILLSMVYYIDRLCALYPAFVISSLTVHRFLIASATVASKGLSDSFWTNATYARVGGISLRELALLEMEFLVRVQWRIVPKPEVLVDYYRSLVERSEGYVLDVDGHGGSAAGSAAGGAAGGAGAGTGAGTGSPRSSSSAGSRSRPPSSSSAAAGVDNGKSLSRRASDEPRGQSRGSATTTTTTTTTTNDASGYGGGSRVGSRASSGSLPTATATATATVAGSSSAVRSR
ncbi:MAG: hypothetical protein M1815_004090 [Lichina confinis]|nr:MAG: hypothetical protein M1815_004090 [Lichina confinis]